VSHFEIFHKLFFGLCLGSYGAIDMKQKENPYKNCSVDMPFQSPCKFIE
jgi:hypothetical protein